MNGFSLDCEASILEYSTSSMPQGKSSQRFIRNSIHFPGLLLAEKELNLNRELYTFSKTHLSDKIVVNDL